MPFNFASSRAIDRPRPEPGVPSRAAWYLRTTVGATEGQRRAEGQQRAAERVEPRREVPTHTPAERAHRVAVGEEQGAVQAGRQIRERRLPQRGELAPAHGARLR